VIRPGLALALAVALLDQASKWLVMERLFGLPFSPSPGALPWAEARPVTDFFNMVTVWNRGVSFGLFNSGAPLAPWLLSLMALGIASILAVWLYRTRSPACGLALGAVIGGAVGNVIDRIRLGAVFDFLDFHVLGWHWPAFNLADAAISCGVVLLLLTSGGEKRKDSRGGG